MQRELLFLALATTILVLGTSSKAQAWVGPSSAYYGAQSGPYYAGYGYGAHTGEAAYGGYYSYTPSYSGGYAAGGYHYYGTYGGGYRAGAYREDDDADAYFLLQKD